MIVTIVAINTLCLLERMAVVGRFTGTGFFASAGAAAAATLAVFPATTRNGNTVVFSGEGAGLMAAVDPVRTGPASL